MAAEWRLLCDGPAVGPWNMGVDEALLASAAAGLASLRFYGGSGPWLSLGYAQGFTGYSLTPEDWVSGLGEDQERHTYPPTLTAPDSSGTSSMTAPRN